MSRLRMAVATIVAVVWAFVVIYATAIDVSAIQAAQLVTPVMLGVVGWLFAEGWLKAKLNGNGNGKVNELERS